ERQVGRDQELPARVHHRLAGGGVHGRRGVAPSPARATTIVVAARPASAGSGGGQNENRGHRPESAARYTSHLISSHFGLAFHAGDRLRHPARDGLSTIPGG